MSEISIPPLKPDFISYIKTSFPDFADSLLYSLNTPPTVGIRLNNRKKCDEIGFSDLTPVNWCDSGFYLSARPQFTLNPLLHAGAFYVQDPSSMIIQEIISRLATSPVVFLDLCAAPGGKTSAAINALPDGSVIVANEYIPPRAKILHENMMKWGFPATIVTNSSPDVFGNAKDLFDIIIVDAPCSGEGMMRKDATARSQWSTALVGQCASLQRRILASAIHSLKKGGYLIYSTCTFNTEENERNAEWINRELGLEPVNLEFPDEWGISKGISTSIPCLRFMPHITRGEGLFTAVFKKNGSATPARLKSRRPKSMPCNLDCRKYITNPDSFKFCQNNNSISAIPEEAYGILSFLETLKGLKIISAGIESATLKGRDMIPTHALALSNSIDRSAFISSDLSLEDALHFLRRENINLDSGFPKGFILLTYKNIPLGFVKNLGSRTNSLLPSELRIRNL